ncbi:MAG: hypothetical protein JHC19_06520 [Desulfurococcaceae archaeon]|nr:hypothetical protein [Desulfurococcaceae archaeon]
MDVSIIIPKKLVEEIARRGLDLEEVVLNSLIEKLRLDPATSTEARLELNKLNNRTSLCPEKNVSFSFKLSKYVELYFSQFSPLRHRFRIWLNHLYIVT